jgi:hypothetical protein
VMKTVKSCSASSWLPGEEGEGPHREASIV